MDISSDDAHVEKPVAMNSMNSSGLVATWLLPVLGLGCRLNPWDISTPCALQHPADLLERKSIPPHFFPTCEPRKKGGCHLTRPHCPVKTAGTRDETARHESLDPAGRLEADAALQEVRAECRVGALAAISD